MMRTFFIAIVLTIVAFGCVNSDKKVKVAPLDTSSLMPLVTVSEVIQTSAYTYLKVTEKNKTYWMAVTKQEASVGDKFYYDNALEMTDFKSKELDRVFDTILFVQNISAEPIAKSNPVAGKKSPKGKALEAMNPDIHVPVAEGGISIADLFSAKSNYENKKVKVSGQVVKVNQNIMSRNWIHIQDGSQYEGNYDLTITSQQTAKVGDVITVEGIISLEKDFGAGYLYDLIMEDGKLTK